jgi:hypothetical protein
MRLAGATCSRRQKRRLAWPLALRCGRLHGRLSSGRWLRLSGTTRSRRLKRRLTRPPLLSCGRLR